MHEYEVGDKVRFVSRSQDDTRDYVTVGNVYTVAEIGSHGMELWVKVDHPVRLAGMFASEVVPA